MPVRDPRVAVVLITHNRRAEVLRSLGHLTTLPEAPQVFVVDNASTDGTAEAVARHFPDVRVLRADDNLGAAGRTLGASAVDAPYIAFCDDDTWWEPGSMRRAADLFDSHPRLAVLTGRVLVGPEQREDPTCAVMAQSPVACQPGMPGPALLGFLAGASMVRREPFLEVGGFPSRLCLGGEEEWPAVELAARGWWLCYVPDIVIHHYPSRQRNARARHWYQLRNALWFAWMRRPLGSALRQTLSLARTLRGRTGLRGFAAALAGLPWVLRERRVVPPTVEAGLRRLDRLRRP